MKKLSKAEQIQILKEAEVDISTGQVTGICEAILYKRHREIRLIPVEDGFRPARPVELVPSFTKSNVQRLCEENGLPEPTGRIYWWGCDDQKTRVKVISLLIKDLCKK